MEIEKIEDKEKLTALAKVSLAVAVVLSLFSMSPWFFWDVTFGKGVLVVLYMVMGIPLMRRSKDNNKLFAYVAIFLVFDFFYAQFMLIPPRDAISKFLNVLPLVCIPFYSLTYKKTFLRWLTRVYSSILAVSLVAFAMWMVGVNFPYTISRHFNEFYQPFTNYYLFVVQVDMRFFTRFSSVFVEAGYVGMVSAILLYVNGYSWKKWENVVMTIALIWSFSLAGYLLYICGILLHLLTQNNGPMKFFRTLVCIIVGISAAFAVVNHLNGDILDDLILSRLEFDSSKGVSGNNRNTRNFNRRFNNLNESGELVFGVGTEEYNKGRYGFNNSSYKNFIVEQGYIGLILLWSAMFLYFRAYPSKRGRNFMILMALSFLQRPYMLWAVESYTFLCAITCYHYGTGCDEERTEKPKNDRPKQTVNHCPAETRI